MNAVFDSMIYKSNSLIIIQLVIRALNPFITQTAIKTNGIYLMVKYYRNSILSNHCFNNSFT